MTHAHPSPLKPPMSVAPAAGDCELLLGALAHHLVSTLTSTPLEGTK
jgi:hypothetical protein